MKQPPLKFDLRMMPNVQAIQLVDALLKIRQNMRGSGYTLKVVRKPRKLSRLPLTVP